MTLTDEQKQLLQQIVNDKFSIGAFSGMIFNSLSQQSDWNDDKIQRHVQLALRIRLQLLEMTK